MKCNEYQFQTSAYLDGQIGRNQNVRYQAHLDECADCRSYLSQLEHVSAMMSRLPAVEVPRELRSYVMAEVRRQRTRRLDFSHRAFEMLFRLNPHLVSYSVGIVASVILFAATLAGFRPIGSLGPIAQAADSATPIIGSDQEYHSYNDLPPDRLLNSNEHDYELPRVSHDSSLVSFGNIAYRKRGDEGTSALIEVGSDGRARVVEMLEKPKDPDVSQFLRWSLSKRRPFQPAILSGKPVQTRIVLIMQKVDVSG